MPTEHTTFLPLAQHRINKNGPLESNAAVLAPHNQNPPKKYTPFTLADHQLIVGHNLSSTQRRIHREQQHMSART
jgi:hypothetical protein